MAMTDESGVIAENYSYDAYGKVTTYGADGGVLNSSNLALNSYTYTGRRIDSETGLMYFRARYYSPELGRFISRDPLKFVDGMNLYAGYFVMWGGIDPTGMECNISATVGVLNPNFPDVTPSEPTGREKFNDRVHELDKMRKNINDVNQGKYKFNTESNKAKVEALMNYPVNGNTTVREFLPTANKYHKYFKANYSNYDDWHISLAHDAVLNISGFYGLNPSKDATLSAFGQRIAYLSPSGAPLMTSEALQSKNQDLFNELALHEPMHDFSMYDHKGNGFDWGEDLNTFTNRLSNINHYLGRDAKVACCKCSEK